MRRRYITSVCLSLVNIYKKNRKKLTPPLAPYLSSQISDSDEETHVNLLQTCYNTPLVYETCKLFITSDNEIYRERCGFMKALIDKQNSTETHLVLNNVIV